jgi:glutamyl-tRNA reductase
MKYSGESLEDWIEKVRQYELAKARIRVIDGGDPELVLEQMSKNIMNKILHVIVSKLKGK